MGLFTRLKEKERQLNSALTTRNIKNDSNRGEYNPKMATKYLKKKTININKTTAFCLDLINKALNFTQKRKQK